MNHKHGRECDLLQKVCLAKFLIIMFCESQQQQKKLTVSKQPIGEAPIDDVHSVFNHNVGFIFL